jgi:subtilase family serine protease
MAGIQALINQYTGSTQGNPNETLYKLAAAEYGARGSTRCNSSAGAPTDPIAPDSTCIFHDVTQGDTDVPCTGTTNCFGAGGTRTNPIPGVLSTSSTTLGPAYPAGTGWDYATGLGSINVYNLVTQF